MTSRRAVVFVTVIVVIVVLSTHSNINFFGAALLHHAEQQQQQNANGAQSPAASSRHDVDSSLASPSSSSQQNAAAKTQPLLLSRRDSLIEVSKTFFPASFLQSSDAAGQIWEFSTVSSPSLKSLLVSPPVLSFDAETKDEAAAAVGSDSRGRSIVTTSVSTTPRPSLKTADQILAEYKSCTGTGSVLNDPNATDLFLASHTTPMWRASEADIDAVCQKRGTRRIADEASKPLLVYGALFGFEVDVLEMVFHEALPVVDAMVLVESSTTHSLKSKPLVFQKLLLSRLKRFAPFVVASSSSSHANSSHSQHMTGSESVEALSSSNAPPSDAELLSAPWFGKDRRVKIFPRVFAANGRVKSGWTIEKKQRREFSRAIPLVAKHLSGVHSASRKKSKNVAANNDGAARDNSNSSSSPTDEEKFSSSPSLFPPVIFVSQLDLDEIPTRETLLYWKHCQQPELPLRVIWFRYQLECQQERAHSRFAGTIWSLPSIADVSQSAAVDLYARRRWVKRIESSAISANSAEQQQRGRVACQMLLGGGDNTAWHLSAFGGVKSVFRKNRHSPHTHIRHDSMEKVADQIRTCVYNGEPRWRLPAQWWACRGDSSSLPNKTTSVMPVALPHFVAENVCLFTRMGWLS